jgi:hypothetical protein
MSGREEVESRAHEGKADEAALRDQLSGGPGIQVGEAAPEAGVRGLWRPCLHAAQAPHHVLGLHPGAGEEVLTGPERAVETVYIYGGRCCHLVSFFVRSALKFRLRQT